MEELLGCLAWPSSARTHFGPHVWSIQNCKQLHSLAKLHSGKQQPAAYAGAKPHPDEIDLATATLNTALFRGDYTGRNTGQISMQDTERILTCMPTAGCRILCRSSIPLNSGKLLQCTTIEFYSGGKNGGSLRLPSGFCQNFRKLAGKRCFTIE